MLKPYYNKINHFKSRNVLEVIDIDIKEHCKEYDYFVNYAGRGNSRKFSISEILIPEFEYNEIFYIHDCMYELVEMGIQGYSKELADELMYELLKYEKFKLAYVYYLSVKWFG